MIGVVDFGVDFDVNVDLIVGIDAEVVVFDVVDGVLSVGVSEHVVLSPKTSEIFAG